MLTIFDFSQNISKLNKERNFKDALNYFKLNKAQFTSEEIRGNKYIVSDIILALIEINRYDSVFDFIKQFDVTIDAKSFPFLLKKLKNKPSINWNFINNFCDLISIDQLDTECKIREVERKGARKKMEFASAREDWLATKTKTLFELKQYQECFNLSKRALELLNKFHYSNDIWFARRIALSKKCLGEIDEALDELLLILKTKKEWFIQVEIAEIFKEKGDIDQAFKYAIDAINNFGELTYKVKLLEIIGDLLVEKKDKELAFKHYSLAKLLRLENEWKVPGSLLVSLDKTSVKQINSNEMSSLVKELKKYWNKFKIVDSINKEDVSQLFSGKIIKIINNNERGIDGFIEYSDNKSIYFSVNINHVTNDLNVGAMVKFKILPKIQDKKERAIIITK